MQPTVSYLSTAADDRHATRLVIAPDGVGKLAIGSNRDVRTRPIGRFEARIPSRLAEQLGHLVSGAAFAQSQSQSALVPDESYRRIQVALPDGSKIDKILGEELATPRPFGEAERTLGEAIEYLIRSPVAALAMGMATLPPRVRQGEDAEIELQLVNVGRLPYRITAPDRWGQEGATCELSAIRSDVPLAELGMQDQHFAQLDGGGLVAAAPPITGPSIQLAPGAQVRLVFRQIIDWQPGAYRVEIALSVTAEGEDGGVLFAGGLVSAPGILDVFVQ